eukprot:CAMPEP_0115862042 /NCGR_PEP_ID=MMETSP0287-20121206/17971_1 /TAXON_ID=412157 /ORGANISM="Chrysochromulina rotalis, Strain UIO044" /LENGTH=70 /DNA_ID=CAMNT_0003316449 /DNA_START=731 /DNA_END=943 /DNA_ORIENTATION=-
MPCALEGRTVILDNRSMLRRAWDERRIVGWEAFFDVGAHRTRSGNRSPITVPGEEATSLHKLWVHAHGEL